MGGRRLAGWAGLMLAAGLGAEPPVAIAPAGTVVVGGEACTFAVEGIPGPWRWSVAEDGGGRIHGATGRYEAPEVPRASRFHVLAGHGEEPALAGRAEVTVLPRTWFERPSGALPFLVPGTGRRFGGDPVLPWCPPGRPAPSPALVTGYGMPVTLRWTTPRHTEAQLLSYREARAFQCWEVTGASEFRFCPAGPVSACILEALHRGADGVWRSFERWFQVAVRGVLPVAGPDSGLRAPAGLVRLGGGLFAPERLALADPAGHTVTGLAADGTVTVVWGRDGERGHRDGGPLEARFDGPTFLAPDRRGDPAGFLVADSGNHVLRKVDPRGRVVTLAGAPGQAGHRDADDPLEALFRDPQGLATDGQGTVYVADRGNHVIRRVDPWGRVTTLAGEPGQAGTRDGSGPQARFSRLVGLALDGDGHLYAADGHALRRITGDGRVTTVLGRADRAGFLDDWERGRADLAGVPCLNAPWALEAALDRITFTDSGNHALREFRPSTGTLKTLAGDPREAGVRYGLLRDGVEGPLDPGYAALEAPRGLAAGEGGDCFVATGTCVVQAAGHAPSCVEPAAILRVERSSVGAGEPFRVDFGVAGPEGHTVWIHLEWLDGDGAVAGSRTFRGPSNRTLGCLGQFSKAGAGTVRLRAITDQGQSVGARKAVQVRCFGTAPDHSDKEKASWISEPGSSVLNQVSRAAGEPNSLSAPASWSSVALPKP